jgi:hypothetical protein
MNRGVDVRIVAADELGNFPKRWFAWTNGQAITTGFGCALTKSGNKIRVEIPAALSRCSFDLFTNGYVYHEHFGSNPESGCLVWLECQEAAP